MPYNKGRCRCGQPLKLPDRSYDRSLSVLGFIIPPQLRFVNIKQTKKERTNPSSLDPVGLF
jgi:hypothetical protein